MSPMTITELLKVSSDYLKLKKIDQPRLTAEILLSHSLSVERLDLYLNGEKPLTENEISRFRNFIRRRVAREPVQYITGSQEFRSMSFNVGPGVLIPRPETELLVERVLVRLSEGKCGERPRILDLGTGCGAIAVALAAELPGAYICATDISSQAIAYARKNAENNGLKDRIAFLIGDWLEPFSQPGEGFDVIASNPPYVSTAEWRELQAEVRRYEPETALTAGDDGMEDIRRIIEAAPAYIAPGGWLFIETAPWHTGEALRMMDSMGRFSMSIRSRDYGRRYRVVEAQLVEP
ncbi:MAG TPA: peptide chain release factor N(5)-glutamine methyltransferase [Desulfobacteraceae bacterium]|nr:peptide chain release factor N(5)-glutamine methyltransferase [Desulfobacteraceae bacterium]